MKKLILIMSLLGGLFGFSSSYAQSFNSDSTNHVPLRTYKETLVNPSQSNQNQSLSCPAPFTLGNIQQRRDVYKAIDLDGKERITGYGPWTETSRNCHRNITQNQTLSCPANQRGTWTQVRNYIEYYNGTISGDTGWQTNNNTCNYYFIETRYNYSTGACPSGYVGSTTLTQSYEYWSDGSSRNSSGWWTSANNCIPASVTLNTPHVSFSPRRSGHSMNPSHTQIYGPYAVSSNGVTMTLQYYVYVVQQKTTQECVGGGDAGCSWQTVPNYARLSTLKIWLNVPGTVTVWWDRPYASFGSKYLNTYGIWSNVPNSQWTDNATSFIVRVDR